MGTESRRRSIGAGSILGAVRPFRRLLASRPRIEKRTPVRRTVKRRSNGARLFTAIQIGPVALKVARVLQEKAGTKLLSLRSHRIRGLSDAEVTALVRAEAFAHPGGAGTVILVAPLSEAISRTVRLPSHDGRELEEMVRLQVRHQIPLRWESLTYGFRVASKDGDGYATIHIAVIDRAVVDRPIEILRAAGLEPDSVQLDVEGFTGLPDAAGEAGAPRPGGVRAFVDVDGDGTTAAFAIDGRLAFTRKLSSAAADLLAPEDAGAADLGDAGAARAPERLAGELRRTVSLFSSEAQREVAEIVLTGVPDACRRVRGPIEAALGVRVTELDAVERLKPADEAMPLAAGDGDVSFAALLGILSRGGAAEIELLPKELVTRRGARARRRVALQMGLRVAALIALSILAGERMLSHREARLKALDGEIRALMPAVSRIEEIEKRVEIIERRIETKGLALEFLREVYTIAPEQMALTRLSYGRTRGLVLRGSAPSMGDLLATVPKLEGSPLFKNVLVGFASKRAAGAGEATDFQVNMAVEPKGMRHEAR